MPVSNIDELVAQLHSEHSNDLDTAFSAFDLYNQDTNQNHIYNNIIVPGQLALHSGLVSKLDQIFENDEAKLENKETEVKLAVTSGLENYFRNIQPSTLALMQDLDMNADEKYEFLTSAYDKQTLANTDYGQKKGISSIASLLSLTQDKQATAGHLKRKLHEAQVSHAAITSESIDNTAMQIRFSSFDEVQMARYLIPKIESAGYEIKNKAGYANLNIGQLIGARTSALENKEHPYLQRKDTNPS
jgi:hypothetical protein